MPRHHPPQIDECIQVLLVEEHRKAISIRIGGFTRKRSRRSRDGGCIDAAARNRMEVENHLQTVFSQLRDMDVQILQMLLEDFFHLIDVAQRFFRRVHLPADDVRAP